MTLHLVTMPPTLHEGSYHVERISSDEAAKEIREAHRTETLVSHINFASTAQALRGLTGLHIDTVSKIHVPPPNDGDYFLNVRLRTGVSKNQRIGLADLEFYWIGYEL